MRLIEWLSIFFTFMLFIACFSPWVIIESKNIMVSGHQAIGTAFGKPGYMHILLGAIYLLFILIDKWWSKRIALFIGASNVAWAIRNFIIISACHGGECPVKKWGIYLVLASAIAMLIAILFNPTLTREKDSTEL
jgi:hypothetical protein